VTERLEAMLAAERLLSAVQATVLRQVMFVLESFVTDGTDKRPLTCHHNNQHNVTNTTYTNADSYS